MSTRRATPFFVMFVVLLLVVAENSHLEHLETPKVAFATPEAIAVHRWARLSTAVRRELRTTASTGQWRPPTCLVTPHVEALQWPPRRWCSGDGNRRVRRPFCAAAAITSRACLARGW